MKIAYAIPVHKDCYDLAKATFIKWKDMGYFTVAYTIEYAPSNLCDLIVCGKEYKGWAWAINELCLRLPDAEWIVTGGHDIYPAPTHSAKQIGHECTEYFAGTFGVMQPAGDQFGAIRSKRACVSPWLGRDWCLRANGGTGPLNGNYAHMWADTELLDVAKLLNKLWWREDLNQYHDHHTRRPEHVVNTHPPHLNKAAEMEPQDKALYLTRRELGFPGHQPLTEV